MAEKIWIVQKLKDFCDKSDPCPLTIFEKERRITFLVCFTINVTFHC